MMVKRSIEDMDDVVQNYCCDIAESSDELCGNCKIKHLCAPIMGDFEEYPEILEQAYEIVAKQGTASTPVNHPSHYNQGGIECIDAMLAAFGEEAVKNFCLVNAFKYVWRARDKNGMEDIDKAIWYLNKFKELNESD